MRHSASVSYGKVLQVVWSSSEGRADRLRHIWHRLCIVHSSLVHWNENVVILTKFSSLAALEVVILTTFSAASDENFIKMKTFPFQCVSVLGMSACYNKYHLTHWGRDKMADISQTTFSNAFSWMKTYEIPLSMLRFHWILLLWVELTAFQHWFR